MWNTWSLEMVHNASYSTPERIASVSLSASAKAFAERCRTTELFLWRYSYCIFI